MSILTVQQQMQRRQRRKQIRLGYDKWLSLILAVGIFASLLVRSPARNENGALQSNGNNMNRHLSKRLDKARQTLDYSEFSCENLYDRATDPESQCAYAQTCNDGDGVYASFVFCPDNFPSSSMFSSMSSHTLMILVSVPLVLFLMILFRVLGSTAEEFFSPGLEMFSIKLGLPERFAGVTLLALGNGAPDVASTVNAIRNDHKRGYLLALGELTGASMVASTVIVGVVAFVSSKPPHCRTAFVRDIVMFILTMVLVFCAFNDGTIIPGEIRLFIALYLAYVFVVLAADIFHRRERVSRRSSGTVHIVNDDWKHDAEKSEVSNEMTSLIVKPSLQNTCKAHPPSERTRSQRVIDAFSNYSEDEDAYSTDEGEEPAGTQANSHPKKLAKSGWGRDSENGTEPLLVFHPHHGGVVDLKQQSAKASSRSNLIEIGNVGGQQLESPEEDHPWWQVHQELTEYVQALWIETYGSEEYNVLDKILMTFWLWYYFMDQFDVEITEQSYLMVGATFVIPLLVGLLVLRFAPRGNAPPRPAAAVPLTLIGFIVSATWLDLVADKLVSLMTFFGIICHIPSTIMGLTVLAWGNSSQDLIANMTVARKDLSTMAITASFAGPVFNILVGLGIGFAILNSTNPGTPIAVHLDNPLRLGFLFCTLNGVLVIVSGVFFGKGFLPKKYGYVALFVYLVYVVASITV